VDEAIRDAAARLDRRYATGDLPWDHPEPPPEVMELADRLAPGRAVDLGCGHGRAAIHLALRGWKVDGVDLVPRAVVEARRRSADAGVYPAALFVAGSVTRLPFAPNTYDLAIDVGCLHRMDATTVRAYRSELRRILKTGATFVLFAHLAGPATHGTAAGGWIDEGLVRAVFLDSFALVRFEPGPTVVRDMPPRPSAWFWFRRVPGA
jgi:SAM-dependent methyltransferase